MTDGLEERATRCPYCGEAISLLIDTSAGDQRYTEDCPVCCQPMVVEAEIEDGEVHALRARREDE
jgi:hypothetical protein